MMFALDMDDGRLLAFASAEDAAASCKAVDAQDGYWRFFAADGSPLEARFERSTQPVPVAYTLQEALSGRWLQELLEQVSSVAGCGLDSVARLEETLKVNRGKRTARRAAR